MIEKKKEPARKKFRKKLNSEFVNLKWVFFAAVLITFLPLVEYYSKVELDIPLFITEWVKTCLETVILALIIHMLVIYRDFKLEIREDKDYLSDNLLFFVSECTTNLSALNNNSTTEDFNNYGRNAGMCWQEINLFFQDKKYLKMKDKEEVKGLYYLHIKLIHDGSINLLNNYFTDIASLDNGKIGFINHTLKKILNHIQS